MMGHLTAYGVLRLLGGFWLPAGEYPGPLSVLILGVAAAGWLAIIVTPPRGTSRGTLLGLTLVVAAIYATIALGRGPLYARVPFHAADAPRYH
jgi:hypothetical protein